MRALTHLALGFSLGLLAAARLKPREDDHLRLVPYRVTGVIGTAKLINEEHRYRRSIADGDTIVLPGWKS